MAKGNALKYAEDVLSGKIIACKWVRLACQRFIKDLKRKDIWFDHKAADRAVEFFKFIPHVKGEWAGQPIKLELWQEFLIRNIFGWKKGETRRFKTVYLEVARKNSKSTLLAALGLYLTRFDNEPGAEVYSAATTREQAKLVFNIAKRMVETSKLKNSLETYKNNIHCDETGSKFEPLSSDYNSLDGLNISVAIIDELHAHKTRDLYDVLDTATGARRQPLIVTITTAGFDKHSVCFEIHNYTEKILEGTIEDDTHFGVIYTIDAEDFWEDEKVWIKANPNLGVSVKLDDLKQKAIKAKEIPSQTNAFLTKHLDVWTESVSRWITTDKWTACGFPVDAEKLKGRVCYGGLDLSSTTDVSALVLVFPPIKENDKYEVVCRFWIPADNMRERVRKDRVPYDVWARQGLITTTPGNIIDYSFILNQIDQDARDFDLREIAFDRWGSTKIIQDLQAMGFEDESVKHTQRHLIDFGQGFASMASPTKELEKMILACEIAHGNNPVLAWMMSNVVIRQDPAGNMKPDKGASTERIDGIVSLIMALSRAVREDNSKSIYEDRGVITI